MQEQGIESHFKPAKGKKLQKLEYELVRQMLNGPDCYCTLHDCAHCIILHLAQFNTLGSFAACKICTEH